MEILLLIVILVLFILSLKKVLNDLKNTSKGAACAGCLIADQCSKKECSFVDEYRKDHPRIKKEES